MIARVDDARIFFETGFAKRVQDQADLGVDETAQTPICRDRPFSLVVVREEMVLTDDAIQRLDPWVTFVAVPRMHFRERNIRKRIHFEKPAGHHERIMWRHEPDIKRPRLVVRRSGARFQPFAGGGRILAVVEIVVRNAGPILLNMRQGSGRSAKGSLMAPQTVPTPCFRCIG